MIVTFNFHFFSKCFHIPAMMWDNGLYSVTYI